MTPRPRPLSPWTALLVPIALATGACNGDKDETTDDSGDPPIETCADDDACAEWEICEPDGCITGDRNNSLDEAEAILWDQEIRGVLQQDGDQDYYSFQAEGGEFIRISTQHVPEEREGMDTVVSLYSPTGKLHMQEDDHAVGPVSTYDTVLYAYLPDAGTWTIVVEDLAGVGETTHAYELLLRETGGHTRETDAIDDASYDLDVDRAGTIWAVGVALEETGDADYIQLNLPWEECPIYVRGSQFTSGTDAVATVDLYDADGVHLMHKEGLGPEGSGAYFEVNGGEAVLEVSDAQGGGGDDYWTFVYISVDERGYSWPSENEDNGLPEYADVMSVEWETNEWGTYGVGLTWGTIDPFGDEDWYEIEVDDGYYLTIRGSSDDLGSYLDGYVTVYDSALNVVASADDGSDDFPDLYNLGPLDAGTYYVLVTSVESTAEGLDQYYRMSVAQSDYQLAEN
ncbi:MAG: hypothetical protein H6739_38785 [Alphaproteobacteria bacterium]|nr:hypothetical protein [Alphaproteobacteria bacterium]